MVVASESVLELVRRALDEFDDVELDTSCRRAYRVARLCGDGFQAGLLQFDLRPVEGATELVRAEMGALFPDLDARQLGDRHVEIAEAWVKEHTPSVPPTLKDRWQAGMIVQGSVAELVEDRARLLAEAERLSDMTHRTQLAQRASMDAEILHRIRHRVFAYLCDVETRLSVVVATERIFDAHRLRVDLVLRESATEVLEQFSAAYRRAVEGDAEARSHALTSCRRILKTVADRVCPATGEKVRSSDGRERELSDDKYVTRILHFVSQTDLGTSATSSIRATSEDVGRRLDGVYQLSNKGVHAQATIAEVEWCVIQTYLLAGEILHLTSAAAD